jgi:glutamate racemase
LRALVGPDVQFIETGEPVARQTRRLLESAGLLNLAPQGAGAGSSSAVACDSASESVLAEADAALDHRICLLTTGPLPMLQAAADRWLNLPAASCEAVSVL